MAMASDLEDLLDAFEVFGPDSLRSLIAVERDALKPEEWVGTNLTQALAQVESRRIPGWATRLETQRAGNGLQLRWWSEPDMQYRLLHAGSLPGIFTPLGQWRDGTGGYLDHPITPGETAAFHQLEVLE